MMRSAPTNTFHCHAIAINTLCTTQKRTRLGAGNAHTVPLIWLNPYLNHLGFAYNFRKDSALLARTHNNCFQTHTEITIFDLFMNSFFFLLFVDVELWWQLINSDDYRWVMAFLAQTYTNTYSESMKKKTTAENLHTNKQTMRWEKSPTQQM